MWTYLCRVAGVTPNGGKTGKREAAWALVAVALGLTLWAMWLGVVMVQAMTSALVIVWPAVIVAVSGAYGLEYLKQAGNPPAWPADIVSPERGPEGDEP